MNRLHELCEVYHDGSVFRLAPGAAPQSAQAGSPVDAMGALLLEGWEPCGVAVVGGGLVRQFRRAVPELPSSLPPRKEGKRL